MSERKGWLNRIHTFINRKPESPMRLEDRIGGSFFGWDQIAQFERITGAQWIDLVGPKFNRDIDLSGTLDPGVQKRVGLVLVSNALDHINGKPSNVEPQVLDDGRVVAYHRYVLKGGRFTEGYYAVDPKSTETEDNLGEIGSAKKFTEHLFKADETSVGAGRVISNMLDAMVNVYKQEVPDEK